MKNRLVIAVSGVVCLAALAVAFFVFLWPRFNKDSEEETTAAGTAAATKAPYTATTKTKSANEAPSTMSIFDLGEARLIVTKTERSFDIDVEPVPDVQIYTNPEAGTVVVDGLFMVSEHVERDDFGERRERKTTPGSCSRNRAQVRSSWRATAKGSACRRRSATARFCSERAAP